MPEIRKHFDLTPRELEILKLFAKGKTNKQIAKEMHIAASTVHSHCKSIHTKMGVHTRYHAVARGFQEGLLCPE